MNDHLSGGLLARDFLDSLDSHGHGQKGVYFRFADMQRHSSLSTEHA
jgi:hypothetical protein